MSAGDPPHLPDPPGTPLWRRVWAYWVTGGLAIVLGSLLPILLQGHSSNDKADPPTPPPTGGPTTGPTTGPTGGPTSSTPWTPPASGPTATLPQPVPPPYTTAPATLRVSASVTSVLSQGPAGVGLTKVQANITFNGLKGKIVSIRWHTYNDLTKQSLSLDSTIRSPVLSWDITNWHPTFVVINPAVHWQLQVTAYGPDGTQLATNHSNFTFSS
ncbi:MULTISPECIES: hypothetical protein [Streptomyces]|uniref:hypothetical protein n=1 Tax=Streptomyces TaxID=1883 RepID=UPI00163CBD27|nr:MULTISPECIES: hypothetical protein [Streptomyces]MBC2873947.1 hypothetical protein [Streptomyces sp. TYQ1024]UBI39110.1 hypothetical protein K7I03_23420 [Streptomyces mobaraensis]UKW31690.1 hypothetical protein MCU78_23365 [Streptomyces sp. TYQ1024]